MSETVKVEWKNDALYTTMTFPKKDLVLKCKNGSYTVGWDESRDIVQVVTKENIPILMEYLNEQFALVNDQYLAAKEELSKLPDALAKLQEMLPEHSRQMMNADAKSAKKLFARFPAYADLAEKVLRRAQLEQRLKDLEPSVEKLRNQIQLVLEATKSL